MVKKNEKHAGKGKAAPSKGKSAASSGDSKGAKAKKKKWSKGKVKEKIQRAVVYEGEVAHQQAIKDISTMKLISPASVSDSCKVNLSLARRTINELVANGTLKAVSKHSSCYLYTKA